MGSSLRTLLCCVLALALGCADGTRPQTSSTATVKQVLTFPQVITISTPSPVSPTAPVVVGSSIVRLGPRADVVSGMTVSMGTSGLTADADALLNETWSRGTATLRDRVRVRGTLHARTRALSNDVVIASSDLNPAIDPPSTLSWRVTYPPGPANNVTLPNGGSGVLAPGKHGIVTANSQATLTLSTGTYYLTTLSIQSSATVKLDQANGPVIIYTTDDVTLRGSFVPLAGTAPDLLIAHLGTRAVFVETLFDGALVAPSAAVTLRSVAGIHTGYFAAKEPILDAAARVKYRAPLALIRAATPQGTACLALLAGLVPETEIFRYCGCPSPAVDTDRDGVEDCVDACPSDPLKTTEGKCGCGVPDVDGDGDGVPNCLDQCDVDPNNTSAGECGCVRRPGEVVDLKPVNTPCSNVACGQTPATCNGNGVCGNRNACIIATNCKLVTNNGVSYWFCPGPLTQSAAAAACRAKQTHLVRVNSISEDRFIQRFITKPTWIGANAITTSGVWRWSNQTTNNGDQFWQGAITGTQRNMLFSYWKPGVAPGSQRCAVVQPADGRWVDVDCNQAFSFVCEVPPIGLPTQPDPFPTQGQPPPRQRPCVPTVDSGLPTQQDDAGLAQLQADYDGVGQNPRVFRGAAASPPPDGSFTCPEDAGANSLGDYDAGAGCRLIRVPTNPPNFECTADSDCTPFGSGLSCRYIQDDLSCVPDASNLDRTDPDAGCVGHARCGRIDCPDAGTSSCDQIEICGDPGSEADAGLDPDSDLDSGLFDPAQLFEQGLPDAGPSSTYSDPPSGSGKDHTWCFLSPQNPVPEARQPERDQQAAGKASGISFRFEPDLLFDANVNPLSLGETDLDIHASARLVAGVKVENLFNSGISFDKDILRAVADIRAHRCSVGNDETEFEVFGVDFITMDNKFIFNTEKKAIGFIIDPATNQPLDLTQQTQACNDAVGKFITFSNRAKKAFRDAQQLLTQYHTLKGAGRNLGRLCEDIMTLLGPTAPQVGFFPGGLTCPANEPPEITINRFLDYYQAPGFGQIQQLRDAIDDLVNQTNKIVDKLKLQRQFVITDPGKSESMTIVNVPFFIGPVPMVLQVDAFYGYGVKGFFEIGVQFPFNPLKDEVGDDKPVASVKAGVMPYANAGLSAFVGAGTSLGGFSATLGVEGALTLAKVKAPIFAGAGISMAVTADTRPFEADIQKPVSLATDAIGLDKLTHFGIPTAVKFNVWYNYGAGIHAEDILKGEINAKLRIKFFFFSRTWRRNVVRFNGFRFDADLLSGKSGSDSSVGVGPSPTLDPKNRAASTTNVVEGTTAMGLSEPQAPLAVLQPLDTPDAAPDPDPSNVTPFDAGKVENLFYDNLCCVRPSDPPPADGRDNMCLIAGNRAVPNGPAPCCPGFECHFPGVDIGTRCRVPPGQCKPVESDCAASSECCSGLICTSDQVCQACRTEGGSCNANSDCCPGIPCGPSRGPANTCWVCRTNGQECSDDEDCCGEGSGDGFGCTNIINGVGRCGTVVE